MKKFIVLMLTLALMSAVFAGCKKANETPDAATDEKPLIVIGDRNIYLNEVLFYANEIKGQFEYQYGADILSQSYGDGTVADLVKEQALESTEDLNLTAYVAEQNGVTLTDDEKQVATDSAKSYFDSLDSDIISKYGFTAEMASNTLTKYTLANKYLETLKAEIEINQDEYQAVLDETAVSDPYYASIAKYGAEGSAVSLKVKHILIKTIDDSRNPLPQDEIDAAYAKAQEVLAKANAGDDFTKLVEEYSEDTGSIDNGGEYTFARGEFVPEFEDAAYSMEPGQISDIVESTYGYHIILLEEKDIQPTDDEVQQRKDYQAQVEENAKSSQYQDYFTNLYAQWKEQYNVTVDEVMWDAVTITDESTDDTSIDTDTSTTENNVTDETQSDDLTDTTEDTTDNASENTTDTTNQ